MSDMRHLLLNERFFVLIKKPAFGGRFFNMFRENESTILKSSGHKAARGIHGAHHLYCEYCHKLSLAENGYKSIPAQETPSAQITMIGDGETVRFIAHALDQVQGGGGQGQFQGLLFAWKK